MCRPPQVLSGVSRVLGPQVWNNTIICFTRSSEDAGPPGVAFDDFVDERAQQLRSAIEQVGGLLREMDPAVLRCEDTYATGSTNLGLSA